MIGLNGGLLGSQRTTNTSTGSGVWVGNEQVLLRRANAWPRTDDPYSTNVTLLLHMNGTNNSTSFVDSSLSARTFTAASGAAISTAQSKYGGSSGAFLNAGNGSKITTSSLTDLGLGAGNFTVEFYLYFISAATSYDMIIDFRSGGGWPNPAIWINSSNKIGWTTAYTSTASIAANTWTHVAFVRSGSTVTCWLNGTSDGSFTDSSNMGIGSFTVGAANDNPTGYHLNGYLDEVRITKGVARYVSSFTPPASQFPDP